MQGISGSFGVILTVPIVALFSAWLPHYLENKNKNVYCFENKKEIMVWIINHNLF